MDLGIGMLHRENISLVFEVIPSEVCRFLCATSTSYSVVFGVAFLRAGEVILSERALRSG